MPFALDDIWAERLKQMWKLLGEGGLVVSGSDVKTIRTPGSITITIGKPQDKSISVRPSTDTPSTIGSAAEGSESAESTVWNRTTTPFKAVDLWIQSRTAYFHAGDKKLYGYFRKLSFDTDGRLYAISAETRVEIDAPEDC